MATIRSRNMEAYEVYSVKNSIIFIRTFWFYSYNALELIMNKTFYANFTDLVSDPCQVRRQDSTARNYCSTIS
jgi:hypothetical protein